VILVDTSVWIDHFRRSIALLSDALEAGEVLVHPFIIGELACGEMKQRREILPLLATLPSSIVASDDETLHFIDRHRLMGKGIGYVDAHLLASVTLTDGAQLWTRDKRLATIGAKLKIVP
jgi:predicted nucleic acid-binding protein